MDRAHKQFKKQIENANNILVVSHRGPDMDAFCSMLLVKELLNIYFPEKTTLAKAKQLPGFNIPKMHDITVVDSLNKGGEDLIIIVDAADLDMVCESGDDLIDSDVPIMVIDHHKTITGKQKVLVNEGRSSASEQVIASFRQMLGKRFKLTKEVAELGQYGIVGDTRRFMYELTTPDTFRIFAELVDVSRVDLEELSYKMGKFPFEATPIIIEALRRVTIEGDMAYTYVNVEDAKRWGRSDISEGLNFVKNNYLRFIQGVHWGFTLKPSMKEENHWWISFRSTKGYQKVNKIAEELGGGGHEYASGAKIAYTEPKSLEQVLTDVLRVIKKHTSN
jgi:phosphoesterase RecJ-like protein